jgi:RNA exonuclease 1
VRESREAHLAAEKAAAGRLTRDKVSRYCLPLDDFVAWGYPDPKDQTLIRGGGEQPDGEGSTQTCDRCKVPFVVNSENLQGRFGECRYHYGRTAPARVEGRRKWIYSCCGKERGEAGCEDGVHVFSHKEDGADTMLAKRQGFRTVKQVADEVGLEKIARGAFVEVVGMDCEMICEWGELFGYVSAIAYGLDVYLTSTSQTPPPDYPSADSQSSTKRATHCWTR